MLDLQQLRYFVSVADTESIARAAERLHISQSPLSRQILALESRLGLALFARSKQRLQLTSAGRAFLVDARELLSRAARVEQRALDAAQGGSGPLVVGFVEGAVHSGVLQRSLQALRKSAPDARIELRGLRSTEQLAALQAGDIDVGFAYLPAPTGSGLTSVKLLDEPFMLALPSRHALAKKKVKASDLDGQGFIALPASLHPVARQAFADACAQAGFTPDIRAEAADPIVALGLVQAGIGLAVLQASLAPQAPAGVKFIPVPARFPLRHRVHRIAPRQPHPLLAHLAFQGA
jgi:DNA-binding transcriptional LysR family regulator